RILGQRVIRLHVGRPLRPQVGGRNGRRGLRRLLRLDDEQRDCQKRDSSHGPSFSVKAYSVSFTATTMNCCPSTIQVCGGLDGCQLLVPPAGGDTIEPPMVGSFSGSRCGWPFASSPLTQLVNFP